MNEVLTWGALFAACGSMVAVVTFWFNRGKAEGEALTMAERASAMATSALARSEITASQLAEARVEIARDYCSHAAIDGVRAELHKMNDRLDRVIEGYSRH